jgi:acetyl-CoA carboxylase biotin carboxyl carrier protein
MSEPTLPMLAASDGEPGTLLRAPKLGVWSSHPQDGALVEPGSVVGTLVQLTQRFRLIVPEGVRGRVVIAGGTRDARPVAYGEALFRVAPVSGLTQAGAAQGGSVAVAPEGAFAIVAPTDGVFYRAPALDAPPFVAVGDRVNAGQSVGLIEVMKTFNAIAYGGPGLPDEAEVVEIVAGNGQEVRAGQALVVVKTL